MKIRELIQETTCSGAVATVAMPLGGTLAREGDDNSNVKTAKYTKNQKDYKNAYRRPKDPTRIWIRLYY